MLCARKGGLWGSGAVTPLHPLAGKDLRKIRPFPRPMFIKHQNTADAGIGTETERRFLIGLNCDWTVKADLEIGAPVSPFNPARPFYPHYHRCSETGSPAG